MRLTTGGADIAFHVGDAVMRSFSLYTAAFCLRVDISLIRGHSVKKTMKQTVMRCLYGAAWAALILGASSNARAAGEDQLARTPPMRWNNWYRYPR
jgi:hypothetical protein